jgi:hypothetical protein
MKKETWKMILWSGCVLILVIGAQGCADLFSAQTVREREPGLGQKVSTSYQFEDIPLPPGMVLNRKESFIYETKTTKAGLLIYEGKGEMDKLVNFFKQQMPNYQWRMVSNFELHNVMLTFMKEGWSSIIYILPQGDGNRIEIRVGPIELKALPSS